MEKKPFDFFDPNPTIVDSSLPPSDPIMWRRTSLDSGLPTRLRQQPKAKEENEMEYLPEPKTARKRSFSEDMLEGIEDNQSESEEDCDEEKPKKVQS